MKFFIALTLSACPSQMGSGAHHYAAAAREIRMAVDPFGEIDSEDEQQDTDDFFESVMMEAKVSEDVEHGVAQGQLLKAAKDEDISEDEDTKQAARGVLAVSVGRGIARVTGKVLLKVASEILQDKAKDAGWSFLFPPDKDGKPLWWDHYAQYPSRTGMLPRGPGDLWRGVFPNESVYEDCRRKCDERQGMVAHSKTCRSFTVFKRTKHQFARGYNNCFLANDNKVILWQPRGDIPQAETFKLQRFITPAEKATGVSTGDEKRINGKKYVFPNWTSRAAKFLPCVQNANPQIDINACANYDGVP